MRTAQLREWPCADDAQEWQVLVESLRHKSGRFERTSAWNRQEIMRNFGKVPYFRGEHGP